MRKQASYLVCLILLFCFVSLAKAQTQDLTGVQSLQVTKYATPIYNQYVDNNSGVALEILVVKAKELNKELEVARQNIDNKKLNSGLVGIIIAIISLLALVLIYLFSIPSTPLKSKVREARKEALWESKPLI